MNPLSLKQAENLFKSVQKSISSKTKNSIVICSPTIYLERLKKISKKIALGAQNVFYEEKGAYTGEISPGMLSDIGVKYVILGHSERRAMGESNIDINKKIKMTLSFNLIPILCIGERERDENHEYLGFVKKQIEECFSGIIKNSISKIIIAYEPVWAVGKSAKREASPEEFHEMRIFIKKVLSDKLGAKNIEKVKILYGGSLHIEDIPEFLKENADGFLVGRNSLDPKKFVEIIKICEV